MILLDTHVLLWFDQASERLGSATLRLADVAREEAAVAVSAISFWEVGMLANQGRISTSFDLAAWRQDLLNAGLRELPVDGDIGIQSTRLAGLNSDPADRIILATAIRHRATLITADERLLAWPGMLERQDARA